jgi:hypothetical protein
MDGKWELERSLVGSKDEPTAHGDWVRDVAWAPALGLPTNTIASCSGKCAICTFCCVCACVCFFFLLHTSCLSFAAIAQDVFLLNFLFALCLCLCVLLCGYCVFVHIQRIKKFAFGPRTKKDGDCPLK